MNETYKHCIVKIALSDFDKIQNSDWIKTGVVVRTKDVYYMLMLRDNVVNAVDVMYKFTIYPGAHVKFLNMPKSRVNLYSESDNPNCRLIASRFFDSELRSDIKRRALDLDENSLLSSELNLDDSYSVLGYFEFQDRGRVYPTNLIEGFKYVTTFAGKLILEYQDDDKIEFEERPEPGAPVFRESDGKLIGIVEELLTPPDDRDKIVIYPVEMIRDVIEREETRR